MCLGAAADEVAVDGSLDPLWAVASAPVFVAGVLAVRMMAGVDGKHFDPDFSEILPYSPNWGKKSGLKFLRLYSDCAVLP
jgi:hypothetical protein